MSKVNICPFCGVEKQSERQMNFHLKYSHSTMQHLMHEDVIIHQIEEKLERFIMKKKVLEKEIELIQKIINIKNDKLNVFIYAT